MTNSFIMNGYMWHVEFVPADSPELVDRSGVLTVATTDPATFTMYLSNELKGDFLHTVVLHELGHCAMVSFDLLSDIHRMVKPEYWVEVEEWICNFIADYGQKIFHIAYGIIGDHAWLIVPREIEKFVG